MSVLACGECYNEHDGCWLEQQKKTIKAADALAEAVREAKRTGDTFWLPEALEAYEKVRGL